MGFGDFLGNVAGSVLGTVGGLVGGHQDKIAAQKERDWQADLAEKNIQLQKDFAQQGLRWKVEDARVAGIHPLYALGAQGASFSPVSMGSVTEPSKADAYSQIGQNLGRAIGSTRTAEEKQAAALNLAHAQANLDGQLIDNQIKQTQLRNMAPQSPAFPGSDNFMPGQGNSPLVKVNPKERAASQPGRSAQEAGWVPDVGYSRTDTGLTPVVPSSLSESLEDDLIGKFMWRMRNQLMPNLNGKGAPPASQLPKGANKWVWSYRSQEWQPAYADGINPPKIKTYK